MLTRSLSIDQIKLKIKYLLFPISVFTLLETSIFLLYPNWFTTTKESIDPWIYWGAGDHPTLSYTDYFAQTYYLQRYVVIAPQYIFQHIFGPYFGELAVGIFWSSIIFAAIWKIGLIFGGWKLSLFVTVIFFCDRYFIGQIGISYTMGSTIALSLLNLYYVLQILPSSNLQIIKKQKRNKSLIKNHIVGRRKDVIISGIINGLLLNAYLLNGIIIFICTFGIFLIHRKKLSFYIYVLFSLSCFLTLGFFQIVYFKISHSSKIFILSQIKFGHNLTTHKNPWGDNGFFDFWSNSIFIPALFYWIAIILAFLACLMHFHALGKMRKSSLMNPILYGFAIIACYLASTFSFTDLIGYSWSASPIYILLLIFLLVLGSEFRIYQMQTFKFSIYLILFLIIELIGKVFFANIFYLKIFFVALVLFIIVTMLVTSVITLRTIFHKNLRTAIFTVLLISLCLIRNSASFGTTESGMSGTPSQNQEYYHNLSRQRDLLATISNIDDTHYRIWLTPDSGIPLISSQLYAYSLISQKVGISDCSVVSSARQTKSILVSFGTSRTLTQLSDAYVNSCGLTLQPIHLSKQLSTELKKMNVIAGVVH